MQLAEQFRAFGAGSGLKVSFGLPELSEFFLTRCVKQDGCRIQSSSEG